MPFYIMGLEEDTLDTCNQTINYSLNLNTYMARYSVCTPYPGTRYYDDLNKENRLSTKDLSNFNQQELVYKHKNLDTKIIKKLIQKAYIKYYLRPKVIWNILKEKYQKMIAIVGSGKLTNYLLKNIEQKLSFNIWN